MNNIYYELAQTQLALDAAQKVIRRQKGKLFGKNLLLVGTIGLFWTACKMLDESEKKRKVVYKDGTGCAVVQHEEGTTDSDDPKEYVANDELLWIQFGN